MKKLHFLIFVLIVFAVERLLGPVIHMASLIFPIFVILFTMMSTNDSVSDLSYILVATIFFDLLSGFRFGILTLVVSVVFISIYFSKELLNVDRRSPAFIFFLAFVFITEYILLFSTFTPIKISVSNISSIVIQTAVVLFIMALFSTRTRVFDIYESR
ncbi:MAG: hypothetical protein WD898_02495 [Candidatus Paceibacterota bacterium]